MITSHSIAARVLTAILAGRRTPNPIHGALARAAFTDTKTSTHIALATLRERGLVEAVTRDTTPTTNLFNGRAIALACRLSAGKPTSIVNELLRAILALTADAQQEPSHDHCRADLPNRIPLVGIPPRGSPEPDHRGGDPEGVAVR